jgi:hypothetical protein
MIEVGPWTSQKWAREICSRSSDKHLVDGQARGAREEVAAGGRGAGGLTVKSILTSFFGYAMVLVVMGVRWAWGGCGGSADRRMPCEVKGDARRTVVVCGEVAVSGRRRQVQYGFQAQFRTGVGGATGWRGRVRVGGGGRRWCLWRRRWGACSPRHKRDKEARQRKTGWLAINTDSACTGDGALLRL